MTEPSPNAVLSCAIDGRGVATLTLDRPDKGNSYNSALLEALLDAILLLGSDPAVRAIVLRGSGKHFCVGAEIGAAPPAAGVKLGVKPRASLPAVCLELDAVAKPTIALVHGACIGGGVALVSCCDIVVAMPSSFFSLPEVRLGFAPGPLIPFFLRAIDARGLRRYLLSGERFAAGEAMRLGLVHELCEDGGEMRTLDRLVDEVLHAGPNAIADAKRLLRRLTLAPISKELLVELQSELEHKLNSPEADEGRASFREKRKPRWHRSAPER